MNGGWDGYWEMLHFKKGHRPRATITPRLSKLLSIVFLNFNFNSNFVIYYIGILEVFIK